MHICADELRWIPFLLALVPLAFAYGRHAAWCACDACLRFMRLRKSS